MPPTSQHLAAEQAFRTLLEESDLPPPDDVSFDDPASVLFLWHDRKLAVVIELGEPPARPVGREAGCATGPRH
jgi:hypothetical protein